MAHKPPFSNGILDSRGRQNPLALVTEWGTSLYIFSVHTAGGTIVMALANLRGLARLEWRTAVPIRVATSYATHLKSNLKRNIPTGSTRQWASS